MGYAFRALLFLLLLFVFTPPLPAAAEDRLVNGDFELAGAAGSPALGPNWSNNGSLLVIADNGQEGLTPYNGLKAVGVQALDSLGSGTGSQTVNVAAPGTYTITFAGFAWVWTPKGFYGADSRVLLRLTVDGVVARCGWYPKGTVEKEWVNCEIQWTGQVINTVKVEIMCQADGRSGGWGIAAADGWSLDISPPRPPRQGYLVNPGFELCGPVGSMDAAPGWWSDRASQIVGPNWLGPPGSPSAPFNLGKALGCYGHQGLGGSSLYQYAFMTAGYRALTLRGHIYGWDTEGYAGEATHTVVDWRVDGETVNYGVFYTPGDVMDNGEWYELVWRWAGWLRGSVGLELRMEARGSGSENSWGVAILDDWDVYDLDYTAPGRAVVTDDGEFTGAATQLHCTYSASDPESGITNYQYSIGTSPGATDVCNWMNAGLATEVTRAPLSLAVGGTYYFNVKARNDEGTYGPVGSSDGITVISPPVMSIGEAKTLPDSAIVKVADKVVTRRVGNGFWIEEPDRSSGIAVAATQLYNVIPSAKMSVTGVMGTRDGARVICLAAPAVSGTASIPRPLVMGLRELGGAPVEPSLPGFADGYGPHNIGLLVTVGGAVTQIGGGYFYIDDGSALRDGTQTDGQPNIGVRVLQDAGTLTPGTMVKVTGISTTFAIASALFGRAIQPGSSDVARL